MRKVRFAAGKCYHLYNRGVNRQPIFFDAGNWDYFIARMRHYFRPDLIEVLAYCLMPNHYHLLVHLKHGELSRRVMHPFSVSYSKAVNRGQGRVGPLFQGPFKGKMVDKDEYLTHLSRYIHLNPVLAGLVAHPDEWVYSSYLDYVGRRDGPLTRPDFILSFFPSPGAYAEYVESYCQADREVVEHLMLD